MKWMRFAPSTALCMSKMISKNLSDIMTMEKVIQCSDGMQLSAQIWSTARTTSASANAASNRDSNLDRKPNHTTDNSVKGSNRIICLHGWLDNAASFHLVAPALQSRLDPCDIVCLDFPGHGRSSHRNPQAPIQLISEYAIYVTETIQALQWDQNLNGNNPIILIGHSMGAGVAMLYSAVFPEQIHKLILLEGAGPLTRNDSNVTRNIRQAIMKRIQSNRLLYPHLSTNSKPVSSSVSSSSSPRRKVYPTLNDAIQARKLTANLSPGNQYISEEAASVIVQRATIPAHWMNYHDSSFTASQQPNEDLCRYFQNSNVDQPFDSGPVVFTHDPRLQWPSIQYFTPDQVEQLYRDVQCPVCMITAHDGWPLDSYIKEAVEKYLHPTVSIRLPGSHHFHADPKDAPAVIDSIVNFIIDS